MKTLYCTILLLFFLNVINAQSWQVIYPNEKYNYLLSNQTDSIIRTTLYVESIGFIGTDSAYFLNKHAEFKGLYPPFWFNNYCLLNQTFFLKSKVSFLANSIVQLTGDTNLYFKANCNVGDSWIFDSLTNATAYCDAVYLTTILGFTDSVKRILINNSDTILLSKAHGIIRFPVFDAAHTFYYLAGLENQKIGLTIGSVSDFLNFNVGDEFEYKDYYYNTWQQGTSPRYQTYTRFYRYIILSKTITNDTLFYEIKKRVMLTASTNDFFWYPPPPYSDTANYLTIKYPISNYLKLNLFYNQYNLNASGLVYCIIKPDSLTGKLSKEFNQIYTTLQPGGDTIVYLYNVANTTINKSTFGNGVGLINSFYAYYPGSMSSTLTTVDLLACKVNGIQHGVFLPDTTYFPCSSSIINSNYIIADKDSMLIGVDTTATLSSNIKNNYYLWSTGATTDSIIVPQPGTYTLTITNPYGCSKTTSKTIYTKHIIDDNFITAPSMGLCANSQMVLSSNLSGYQYLWSTGSTQNAITISAPGKYFLKTSDGTGYSTIDSIIIIQPITLPVNLGDDLVLNSSTTYWLSCATGYLNYLWSDGSSTYNSIKINTATMPFGENKIWVRAWSYDCMNTDTIVITVYPPASTLPDNWMHYFSIHDGEIYFIGTPYRCHYEIFAVDGKRLYDFIIKDEYAHPSISLKAWNTGIYIVRITTGDSTVNGKFFVKHKK